MTQKGTTKDELFLLKLYELACLSGDPQHPIDRYVIGRAIGQNDRGINAITVLLAKANFIKKEDENTFYLSENGLRLVADLQQER